MPPKLRHLFGFLASGTAAFFTDAATLWLLIHLGMPPLAARILSIALAMVVAWLGNRTLTFAVATAPTFKEFLAYAALGWSVALLNYLIFAVLLHIPATADPLLATAIASLLAMAASYLGMRFGVFRNTAGK